jgi:hypothetical protein
MNITEHMELYKNLKWKCFTFKDNSNRKTTFYINFAALSVKHKQTEQQYHHEHMVVYNPYGCLFSQKKT